MQRYIKFYRNREVNGKVKYVCNGIFTVTQKSYKLKNI